ncbi:MAG: class I SAM-dependent methyltransferase [Actinobacteria bacterium]|nr:class I SAM-dependent methyltransferase [Actinomycetota bacterium]
MESSAAVSQPAFSLFWCRCETVFLSPLPTDEDFQTMYVETKQFTSEPYVDEARIALILEFLTGRLEFIAAGMELETTGPSILEIGAGNAWMCRAAKSMFPTCRTTAQDITTEVADRCPWADEYVVANIADLRTDEKFDVISLTHVFEHVPDPPETLRLLRPLLHPRGRVFITMPFRPRGRTRPILRDDWLSYSYLHVPAHLQYLSERSMRRLAERTGFEVTFWDATSEGGDACEVHLALAV